MAARLRILSEASNSPSLAAMRAKFQEKFPKAEWYEYEAVSDDNVREGTCAAFGQHVLPVLELANAKVIVSLDADLFGGGSPLAIKYARDFAAGRRLHDKNTQKEMNRLYVIESLHTITGASADHRLACRASEIAAIATELAAALGVAGVEAPKDSKLPLLACDQDRPGRQHGPCGGRRRTAAAGRGPCPGRGDQPQAGQRRQDGGLLSRPAAQAAIARGGLEALVKRMKTGEVKTLLILGGNPVYNAPAGSEVRRGPEEGSQQRSPGPARGRDLAALHVAPFAGPLPGIVGRRQDLQRHGEHRAAADRAAVRRPQPDRGPVADCRRKAADRLRHRPRNGQVAGGQVVDRIPLEKALGRRRDRRHGVEAGPDREAGRRRSARRRRPAQLDKGQYEENTNWSSTPTRCTTAASPTTAGCRNCPIR